MLPTRSAKPTAKQSGQVTGLTKNGCAFQQGAPDICFETAALSPDAHVIACDIPHRLSCLDQRCSVPLVPPNIARTVRGPFIPRARSCTRLYQCDHAVFDIKHRSRIALFGGRIGHRHLDPAFANISGGNWHGLGQSAAPCPETHCRRCPKRYDAPQSHRALSSISSAKASARAAISARLSVTP